MNNYDVKCRIIEEELKTFWPQWHVIRRLGGGAFGDVFEIYRDNLGIREKSALKMIQISDGPATMALIQPVGEAVSRAQDGQTAVPETFRNEIQIMDALRGAPNIVIIEDSHLKRDASSTMLFVRMELLTSFQQMMTERQRDQLPFTIPEVLKIGRDICTALMYCEEKGIIHRDIKPANLFKDNFGNYKVGDFGVSRRMDTVHVALTMTGIGTISYMAPEVYRGTSYNNTVDIYALGLILYQLLNNYRIPFLPTDGSYTSKDIDSANYKRLQGEPLPSLTGTRIGNETVDASLDAMIRKACAIRSEDRYQSAKEFYEDLSAWGTPLAKKFQENIPQGQTENAPQQVQPTQQEQHSRKPKEAVLPRDDEQFQTTPFSFINDVQDVDSLHTGIRNSGKEDLHEPEYSSLDDEEESKKRQKKGGLGKIAAVSALIIAVLLAGARYNMLRGLQASPDSGSTGGGAAAGDEAAGGEKITLIMSQRDEFLSSLEAGAKAAAADLGVNLVTQDANQDVFKQIQYVQDAAADGQEAVIVNPVYPSACQSIIDAAGDMKVVFVNRVPDDTSILNENAVYVGSDDHTSGKFQGDFLAEYFKAKGQTDIKYILLSGIEGQTSTTLRTASVLEALADNGINATETYARSCLYDRNEALNQVGNILADKSKEFDCIICNNDAMALGAIDACNQAGREIDFPIVGIDATADGRQAIKDGTMAMSVFQDPNGQGVGAVAAARNLINGAPLNEGTNFEVDETGFILWVPFEEVTPENVADYDYR